MWKYNYTDELDELYHHGVKGQRWGFRRYQNKDGSLTPAGRRRANKLKEQYEKITGKPLKKKPIKAVKPTNQDQNKNEPKKIKDMSDNELRDKYNRLNMEKQVMQLESDLAPAGKKVMNRIKRDVIAPAMIDAGRRVLTNVLNDLGKEATKGMKPKDSLADLKKEVDELELKKRKKKAEDYLSGKTNK